uniref:Uncharacterized protein n=1 Tax=uncultured Desulfobacterium sp. TaxID=201089 RepID=E1YH34_9BACT|nr:hypothetical protein N47_F15730 [uncultured Desulfobacterium sp.]
MAMGRVDVGVSIPLPPPIIFASPPEVVVIPESYVYAVPDIDVDIFFYNGWWWRPWQGRWYRSQSYSSGWAYYQSVPSFYREIPSGWRNDYRERRWKGHQWNYQRIPHQQVQQNWNNWEKSRHWEKQNSWGVQGLKSGTQSRQQNREVQPKQREMQPQHREAAQPQFRPQAREVQQQHSQPQYRDAPQQSKSRYGKPERRKEEAEPQYRNAPQQSKSQHGKHEGWMEDKQDRNYNDK